MASTVPASWLSGGKVDDISDLSFSADSNLYQLVHILHTNLLSTRYRGVEHQEERVGNVEKSAKDQFDRSTERWEVAWRAASGRGRVAVSVAA